MKIRPVLSRIIGPYVAMVAAWAGSTLGLGPDLVGDLRSALTTATVLMLYGVVHKGLDALGINPADHAGGSDDNGEG